MNEVEDGKAWIKDKVSFGVVCGVLLGLGLGAILGWWL